MKVLFVTSMYYKPGATDAGLAIHRQAVELRKSGIDVRVVCPVPMFPRRRDLGSAGRADPLGFVDIDGVPVLYLRYPNLPLKLAPRAHVVLLRQTLSGTLRKLHARFPFDVLHVHRLYPTVAAVLPLAQRYGAPIIASAVGSDVHTYPEWHRSILRQVRTVIRGSDSVVAVSHALAENILELDSPTSPVRVVYRGVDVDRFAPAADRRSLRAELGLPLEGIGISAVGRLMVEKGVRELLDAMESIVTKEPAVWLAFVGGGPLAEELRTRIASGILKDRVFLAGPRPHDEVPRWINASDIFVLPSYREGLPNVVREAMACGVPVVSTRVGGIAEAVDDGETGLLVPAKEVVPLQVALETLIGDRELRERMGSAGRDAVRSRFSWETSTRDLIGAYTAATRAAGSAHAEAGVASERVRISSAARE